VIATTDLAHVPGGEEDDVARLTVADGAVSGEAPAAGGGAEDRLAA
jgi:hypothetical protein